MQEEKEDTQQQASAHAKPEPIALDKSGALVLRNNDDMRRVTNLWFESQMLPSAFQANDSWNKDPRYKVTAQMAKQRIFTAVQMLQGLGFDFRQTLPLLKNIAFVKGAVFIFGDLPLIIVERSGLMVDKEEWVFDEDGKRICSQNKNLKAKVFGAKVRVKPKGRPWKEQEYTIEDAIAAKLLPRQAGEKSAMSDKAQDSAWLKHTKRMLIMRARGYCLRDNFALAFADTTHAGILESDVDQIPADYEETQVIDVEPEDDDLSDLSDIY